MNQIFKAPTKLEGIDWTRTIFLAGSIDMGKADYWQDEFTDSITNSITLNPRRESWDSSWEQTIDNAIFKQQVEWELECLEKCAVIAMYLAPTSKAPISLLELGLFAHTKKLIVCCPDGYWRKGNVDIVCQRYGIPTVSTLNELVSKCQKKLTP